MQTATSPIDLPAGRSVRLPGRGTTFVREAPGPPGAPTLLLLHGLGATADLNWLWAYPTLGERYRVLAIDHRGHGRGIRSRRHFRLADCADDAAMAARLLGARDLICVGYSMGGPIAQLMWHRHRDLVRGLVLCATSRNFRGHPRERFMFGALGSVAVAARFTPPSLLRSGVHRVMPIPDVDHPLSRWAADELTMNDPRMLIEAVRTVGRFSSHSWVGDIDVPTAVVVTKRDQLVPARRQYKLAATIPGATVHEVDGDHFVCGFAPDRFVPPLADACRTVASRLPA